MLETGSDSLDGGARDAGRHLAYDYILQLQCNGSKEFHCVDDDDHHQDHPSLPLLMSEYSPYHTNCTQIIQSDRHRHHVHRTTSELPPTPPHGTQTTIPAPTPWKPHICLHIHMILTVTTEKPIYDKNRLDFSRVLRLIESKQWSATHIHICVQRHTPHRNTPHVPAGLSSPPFTNRITERMEPRESSSHHKPISRR